MRDKWQKECLLVAGAESSDQRNTMTESTDFCRQTFKIVDKKDILLTVSNAGVYCSIDQVGTVYLV
jgi:hypothetical protein